MRSLNRAVVFRHRKKKDYLKKLEDEILAWPNVSVHPRRFDGREFRFQNAQVGHVHAGGIIDTPFPRTLCDALLAEGLAEEHPWVPDSGWVALRVQNDDDLTYAQWLMRLSYLRYTLKTASDPGLSPRFKSLLEPFVPINRTAHLPARERLSV